MASTKGLDFKKFDLHVHTSASKCYSDNAETCASDIVGQALDVGLAAIAITDHNTGTGIDAVRQAAKGTSVKVFPGVELTVGDAHMHVVALFDLDTPSSHIDDLLAKLELKNKGTEKAYCDCTVQQAINVITSSQFGGLAVLAHSDSSNGVLSSMKNAARIGVIRNWRLLAVEANDVEKARKFLSGTDPDYQRTLAIYRASDNLKNDGSGDHCAAGVGSSYSLFKVDEVISLDSLRLCFGDRDVRIRQPEEYSPGESPRIVSAKITGGMLDGEDVSFHPGLNCILGAKGAGKSVLIEQLRFALDQPSSIESVREDHEEKLRHKLQLFGSVTVDFVDATGKPFAVTRTLRPVDDDGLDASEYISTARLLPVMFLSQNEIVKIAESEREQLAFIDRFFDVTSYADAIQDIEDDLAAWDHELAKCVEAQQHVTELEDLIKKLSEEEEKLSKRLSSGVFVSYRAAEAKRAEINRQFGQAKALQESLETDAEAWAQNTLLTLPDDLKDDPVLQRIQLTITGLLQSVTEHKQSAVAEAQSARKAVVAEWESWKPKYEEVKRAFEEQVKQAGGDDKALEARRQQIAVEIQKKKASLDAHSAAAQRLKDVNTQRRVRLEKLFATYHKRHNEREERCRKFVDNSGGRLKIAVHESSNADAFKQDLLKLKVGSYISDSDIGTLCEKVKPVEIVNRILAHAIGVSDALSSVAKSAGLTIQKVTTLADFLLQRHSIQEILRYQYKAFPEDRPEIRLVQPGGKEVLLKQASGGQKCMAMLLMALCDDTMPVIIDQPEDSLDNRSVWDDVCTKLREHKDHRQFIMATHNSSLAVASDTDKYVVLEESSADHAKVVLSGAVDNPSVRRQVIDYLEGGETTYMHKFAKYGIQRS